MVSRRLRLALVGHVNVGKTTWLRTLACQPGLGQVDDLPGSTARPLRHTQSSLDAELHWIDTPGFHDPCQMWRLLEREPVDADGRRRWERFVSQSRWREQQACDLATLVALRDADACLLVVDADVPVAPKHDATMQLLLAAGVPGIALVRGEARLPTWRRLLARHGDWPWIALDAHRPGEAVLPRLLALLSTRLERDRPQWQDHAEQLRRQAVLAHAQDLLALSRLLLRLAASRITLTDEDWPAGAWRALLTGFRDGAVQRLVALLEAAAGDRALSGPLSWRDEPTDATPMPGGPVLSRALGLTPDDALDGLVRGSGSLLETEFADRPALTLGLSMRAVMHWMRQRQDIFLSDATLGTMTGLALATLEMLATRGHGDDSPLQATPWPLPRLVLLRRRLQPLWHQAREQTSWALDADEAPNAALDEAAQTLLALLRSESPGPD